MRFYYLATPKLPKVADVLRDPDSFGELVLLGGELARNYAAYGLRLTWEEYERKP